MPALSPASTPCSPNGTDDRQPSDRALLAAWRNGGRAEDFTELVRRHFHLVRGIARRQLGEDLAEDTAQAVFTILARKAPDARCLSAWLHRVTVLQCRDAVRRRLREKRALLAAMEIASLSEARDPLEEARPHIDDAIAALDTRDRELLLLRYSEGLSFTAAAARTGRAEPALRKQAGRALEKLSLLLRRRGVSVPAVSLAAGLGGVVGSPPAAQAATVAAGAAAGSGALGAFSLLSITLATMSTLQSLTAGAAAAALLSAIPLGWQSWQLHRLHSEAAPPLSSPSASAAVSRAGSTSASAPEAGNKPSAPPSPGTATPSSPPPPEDAMEELAAALEKEAGDIMSHWAQSVAWTESRSIAMVLGLSPDRESELRAALTEFQESRIAGTMVGGTQAGGERRKYQERRDAWLSGHLSPEELAKVKAWDGARREALIASKAEEALHWISSKVELSEGQKTRLFNAGAARTAAALDKDEYGGSVQFGGSLQSARRPPVEETSGGLLARVLDPDQRQLWEESADRLKYTSEDMPRRLVDRAFEIIQQRGLVTPVAEMISGMLPSLDTETDTDSDSNAESPDAP